MSAIEGVVAAVVGAFLTAILTVILTPLVTDIWTDLKPQVGVPLLTLTVLLVSGAISAFCGSVLRYFGILGAGAHPVGSRERTDYDELRRQIAAGNWIEREYARRLTVFLNGIDRFFGDVRMADRTLFPHAFGLRSPAPLWTAPAFDRCLALALIYPVVVIVLIWTISNHAGPAEVALGLRTADGWRRAIFGAAMAFAAFSTRRGYTNTGWRSLVWYAVALAVAVSFAGATSVAGAGSVAVTIVILIAIGFGVGVGVGVAGTGVGAFVVAIVVAGTFTSAIVVAIVIAGAFTSAFAVAGAVAGIAAFSAASAFVVLFASDKSIQRGLQGIFLSVFVTVMIFSCLGAAYFLSHLDGWAGVGAMLLFFGLLTLVNAPFDWFSLGLTRALMRRGLERGKWWPYFYAGVDALLASAVIAFLAMAMVAGVQLFDDLAVAGGGKRIMVPMRDLLDAIRTNPGQPEYWWIYAMLFSTMLPSLINLFVGGVSLARGVPAVSSWLLRKLKEGEAVPVYDRLQVALVLSVQSAIGIAFAVIAQGVLFWVIIAHGMPLLGIGILDLAYLLAH